MKRKGNKSSPIIRTRLAKGSLGKMAMGLLSKGRESVVQQPVIAPAKELNLKIGIQNGKVVMDFGRPVSYLELTADACQRIGNLLLSKGQMLTEHPGLTRSRLQ